MFIIPSAMAGSGSNGGLFNWELLDEAETVTSVTLSGSEEEIPTPMEATAPPSEPPCEAAQSGRTWTLRRPPGASAFSACPDTNQPSSRGSHSPETPMGLAKVSNANLIIWTKTPMTRASSSAERLAALPPIQQPPRQSSPTAVEHSWKHSKSPPSPEPWSAGRPNAIGARNDLVPCAMCKRTDFSGIEPRPLPAPQVVTQVHHRRLALQSSFNCN